MQMSFNHAMTARVTWKEKPLERSACFHSKKPGGWFIFQPQPSGGSFPHQSFNKFPSIDRLVIDPVWHGPYSPLRQHFVKYFRPPDGSGWH